MSIPIPAGYVADFERLGFGMFVHWGLYSQLGKGEWIMHQAQIPVSEYEKLADTFTASAFDGRNLARAARAAGMKYIVLTTRHHDGFSLYDTCGLSRYDAPHSAAGRDLIAEFVADCREEGIVPFFYHTTLDWHDARFNEDFPAYLEYLRQSVELLCRNYGKIGGLWFDGNWSRPNDDWHEDELYATIRRWQPEAMIINNTGLGARGRLGNSEIDSVTFEQGRPTPMNREGMRKYVAAEMCQTINCHWGIGQYDFNYKSLPYLIESLCACRKVGANYLLNVGPKADGSLPKLQEALIEEVGSWIRCCGESVYAGKPCEISGENRNFALRADGKLFLFVHDLGTVGDANVVAEGGGAGTKQFSGFARPVRAVRWVDNGESLAFEQDGGTLRVNCTGYEYGKNLVVRVAEVSEG